MALSLAEMRAKMESKNSAQTSQSNNGSSDIFKFGDLKAGDEVRIRFVEDSDTTNPFFWRERHSRTLRFNSLLLPSGSIMATDTFISVPAFNLKTNETNCDDLPEEYLYKSNEDVIQQKIKGFWIDGDKTSQALYNKFGKKVTYVFQGFVRSPGYETKLYRFVINKELFNLIKTFMSDSEIDDIPCHIENGRDFILKVSEKNVVINGTNTKVKDYVTQSKWSGKVSPLTGEERMFLETNGSFDLKKFLPKRPTPQQEEIMLQMYNASYDGNPYDIKNWGSTFRPDNIRLDQNGNVMSREGAATANLGTEIPNQVGSYSQPAQQSVVNEYNPYMQGEVAFMNQMHQSMTQPLNSYTQPQTMVNTPLQTMVNQPQMLVDSPVQVQTQPMRTNEYVQSVTEQVQSDSVNGTINSIMSKLNMGM
jgi:hypothetical protein